MRFYEIGAKLQVVIRLLLSARRRPMDRHFKASRVLVFLVLGTSFVFAASELVLGMPLRQSLACTQPASLSDQGPDTFALIPRAVTDPFGRVHLVWSGGSAERYPDTDAIFYSQYDEGQWSSPVDILATNGYASVDSLVLTPANSLIASWRYRESDGSGLRVSRSSLQNPGSARSWQTTPVFATNIMDSALFVDSAGDIHLGFIVHDAATGSGFLAYTRSEDDGETWAQPIEFAPYDASTEARRFATIYADGAGSVQMAWAVSTREEDWSPVDIERISSDDNGASWSEPEQVFAGPRANMPSFLQGSDRNQVYLTWMRGVGFGDSKYAISSSDAGITWTEPRLIIPEKRGMNGPMDLAFDSVGIEYLALAGDQTGIGTRIWVSRNTGENSWSDPLPISGTELHESEFPQAVVRNGNELHVFWLDWGQREVFSVICRLDAPKISSAQFMADMLPVSAATRPSTSLMVPTDVSTGREPTEPSQLAPLGVLNTELTPVPSASTTLAISLLVPLLLVGLVVVWQLLGRGNTR